MHMSLAHPTPLAQYIPAIDCCPGGLLQASNPHVIPNWNAMLLFFDPKKAQKCLSTKMNLWRKKCPSLKVKCPIQNCSTGGQLKEAIFPVCIVMPQKQQKCCLLQ